MQMHTSNRRGVWAIRIPAGRKQFYRRNNGDLISGTSTDFFKFVAPSKPRERMIPQLEFVDSIEKQWAELKDIPKMTLKRELCIQPHAGKDETSLVKHTNLKNKR